MITKHSHCSLNQPPAKMSAPAPKGFFAEAPVETDFKINDVVCFYSSIDGNTNTFTVLDVDVDLSGHKRIRIAYTDAENRRHESFLRAILFKKFEE